MTDIMKRLLTISPLILVLLVAGPLRANSPDGSLGGYAGRVRTAISIADELVNSSESGDQASYSQIVVELKRTLPPSEKVTYGGGTLDIDNRWLHEELDRLMSSNENTRADIASAIYERLVSIEEHINELENATAQQRSRDEDKRKLGEILDRDDYRKPVVQESPFQRVLDAILKWIQDLFPSAAPTPVDQAGMPQLASILQTLLYVGLTGLLLMLAWRLTRYLRTRYSSEEKTAKDDRVVLGETIAADVSPSGLLDEAESLARAGELRLAIRKGYVALLCELNDRRLIALARHKTNRDYLRDVNKRPLFDDFRVITGAFERHWYGDQRSAAGDWEEFREMYSRTLEKARPRSAN